jgi:PAS domain-containing protein
MAARWTYLQLCDNALACAYCAVLLMELIPLTNVHQIASAELFLSFTADSLGFFSWDIPRGVRHHDDIVANLFGVEAHGEFGDTDVLDMLAKIHADDRDRVSKAVYTSIVTGDPYQQTYRVLTPSGKFVEIVAMGRCLQDGAGVPTCFVGIVFETKGTFPGDIKNTIRHHCLIARHLAGKSGNLDTSELLSLAIRSVDSN